jgi:flagellar basal body P-ring protein FlgI
VIKLNEETNTQETDETSQAPEPELTETTDTPTEQTQTTDEPVDEQTDETTVQTDEPVQTTETTSEPETQEPQVVVPVDTREMTVVDSQAGTINVIHEVTIGDLLVSTALFILIIFMLIDRVVRR